MLAGSSVEKPGQPHVFRAKPRYSGSAPTLNRTTRLMVETQLIDPFRPAVPLERYFTWI